MSNVTLIITKGLYKSDELDSAFIKESKENKLLFLNKLIAVVGVAVHEQLAVRASKIAAGAEVDRTNELFQSLAKAVNMKPDNEEVVRKALKRVRSEEGGSVSAGTEWGGDAASGAFLVSRWKLSL